MTRLRMDEYDNEPEAEYIARHGEKYRSAADDGRSREFDALVVKRLSPGSNEDYMAEALRELDQQIGRLCELIRTHRHQQWPEGAPQNSAARDEWDAETEEMIQNALTPRKTTA